MRLTRDTAQDYLKCMPPHIGDPVVDGRTDGRTDGWSRDYYIITKTSITSLPKPGLIGYQIGLAMVLYCKLQ